MRAVVRSGGALTLAVVFALNVVDEFDKVAFAILAPDIQRSLGLSDVVVAVGGTLGGLLVFVAAVPIGWLADRRRRTSLLGICTAFWALFALLTGLAQNTWQLLAARTATGLGKANEGPVQKSILSDAYPAGGRARVFAVHDAANPVGRLLAPLLTGAIAAAVGSVAGWRWVFIVLAIPALVLAAVSFVVPEPRRGANERGEAEVEDSSSDLPMSLGAVFGRLRKIRTFHAFLVGFGALGFGIASAPVFINLMLERQYGLDAWGRALVTTITAVGSLAGAVIGGRYGDRLLQRDPRLSVAFVGGAIVLVGVALPVAVYMPNVYAFMTVSLIQSVLVTAAFIPANAIIAAVTPYRLRSVGFATIGVYLTLVGGVGGAIIAGGISSALDERAAVAITMPIAAAVGGVLVIRGSRFVLGDIAATHADLREERDEQERIAHGGSVPVLELSNVDFSYGHVQVLFGVSLQVDEGEVLALLGTNGAGKSTVARVMSGLCMPDSGAVRLDGRTITYVDPVRRVRCGVVQVSGGKALFPGMTVAENLIAGVHRLVPDQRLVEERLGRACETFPVLGERLDQPAGSLSGGEQQMVALAKSMLLEPRVLIIDELSLGLAPVVVQVLFRSLERLKAQGMTMVIVEQSLNVAMAIADRAVFMEKGTVRFDGPAAQLAARDDLARAVFFGAVPEGTRP